MDALLKSSKISKCSSSRRELKLQLWIWCVLTICLPCASANYFSDALAIHPPGDMYVEYGNPLEIFCVTDLSSTANDIKFESSGKLLESEIINSTTRRLYIAKPEKQLTVFYCHNIKTRKITVARVLVDSIPEPVNDFNCFSQNLDVLNCSWISPEIYSKINNSINFVIKGHILYPACVPKRGTNGYRNCVWTTISQPRYRQSATELIFLVTSCNVFGCINETFTINHFSIVKPNPPIDLKVLNVGTHSVNLTWRIHENMADFCKVEHIVQYQTKIDDIATLHTVDTSSLLLKRNKYELNIINLPYANMLYDVRVYIKTVDAVDRKFWSDFTFINFCTASEKPSRAPDMVAGSFDQGTYNNLRFIRVYWKQIAEYEEAGKHFTYLVVVSQGNETRTLFPDKNKSLGSVLFGATSDELQVTVRSLNIAGQSDNSSHLYIPPEKDVLPLRISSFTKLAYENGTYELSWQRVQHIDNYTLFWCQQHLKENKVCTERIDFVVLGAQISTYVIDLPVQYNYQFAITANSGTKTSGMVWAKIFEQDFVTDFT